VGVEMERAESSTQRLKIESLVEMVDAMEGDFALFCYLIIALF
ncbi:hypothetical protein A2U01_0076497, partial [Trifolium medium]|nr:hypothetical protein [Trifolium medium]